MYRDYGRPQMPVRRGEQAMSLGKWIGTFIIMMIPLIGQIAYIVWLFGGGNNKTRTNWVRASLLISVITTAIVVVLYFVMGTVIIAYLQGLGITIPTV